MAARTARVNPESTWRLYEALAVEAGVRRRAHVADPRVLVGCLRTGRGDRALLVSCAAEPLEVELQREPAGPLSVALPPFGVGCVPLDAETAAAVEGSDARARAR
jgi:beta-glucosidase